MVDGVGLIVESHMRSRSTAERPRGNSFYQSAKTSTHSPNPSSYDTRNVSIQTTPPKNSNLHSDFEASLSPADSCTNNKLTQVVPVHVVASWHCKNCLGRLWYITLYSQSCAFQQEIALLWLYHMLLINLSSYAPFINRNLMLLWHIWSINKR